MRTRTLLTAFFMMFGMTVYAQKENTHKNFIKKIDDAILKYKKTKVDPNQRPDYRCSDGGDSNTDHSDPINQQPWRSRRQLRLRFNRSTRIKKEGDR